MKQESKFTGVIILTDPVYIIDSKGNTTFIYGILYDMLMKMKNDLFSWCCQRYLAYLYGTQRCQFHNGILQPDVWVNSHGAMIILDNSVKNYIYKVMKDDIPVYRLMEFEKPLKLNDKEYEGCFLTSTAPLKRYGMVDDIKSDDDKKDVEREPLSKFVQPFELYNLMDDDCDSDEILVATPYSLSPVGIAVSERQARFIRGVLLNENFLNDREFQTGDSTHTNKTAQETVCVKKLSLGYPDRMIKSFESFIEENKGHSLSNIQSYLGCFDDEDDSEEEE